MFVAARTSAHVWRNCVVFADSKGELGWGAWLGGDACFSVGIEAMVGNVVSPSRGIFLFSPVFVLAPWSLRQAIKHRDAFWKVDVLVAGWIMSHWLVISSFPHWWGGHSYGPRLWTETAVGWVWLLSAMVRAPAFPRNSFVMLALLSALFHAHGAVSFAPWTWNGIPVNVDDAPQRLWDWKDPQALRGWLALPAPNAEQP